MPFVLCTYIYIYIHVVQLHFIQSKKSIPKRMEGSPERHFQSVYSRHTPKQSVHDFSREYIWDIQLEHRPSANPSSDGIANSLHPSPLEVPWNGQTAMLPILNFAALSCIVTLLDAFQEIFEWLPHLNSVKTSAKKMSV